MDPPRPYRIAGAVKAHDPATFAELSRLAGEGRLDGIQVYVKGPLAREDLATVERHASLPVSFAVHAPHHEDGVNPVAPASPGNLPPPAAADRLEAGMNAALELADRLVADTVVYHAGCCVKNGMAEAVDAMTAFRDAWPDPRLALENMPAIHRDLSFVGRSADELAALGGGRDGRYCLDMAHLYVASNYTGTDYADALAAFERLDVVYHHLSNSPAGSVRDRHRPLDAPDGGVPMDRVMARVRAHPGVTTCLEYKSADGAIYGAQLAIFNDLYRWYARG